MAQEPEFSDEILNAFVDNQLSADDESDVEKAIRRDKHIHRRVSALRKVRHFVRLAYAIVPAHGDPKR